jgi:NAD(P)-dependent dehydrogenase (short-subunit alcohol dehydrogenase family)
MTVASKKNTPVWLITGSSRGLGRAPAEALKSWSVVSTPAILPSGRAGEAVTRASHSWTSEPRAERLQPRRRENRVVGSGRGRSP